MPFSDDIEYEAWEDLEDGLIDEDDFNNRVFASPGSALRASSRSNPRNLPCSNCGEPNRLTPADRRRGYQCDPCADAAEGFGY